MCKWLISSISTIAPHFNALEKKRIIRVSDLQKKLEDKLNINRDLVNRFEIDRLDREKKLP